MKIYNKDIEVFYRNNEGSRGGFYPVGANGFWHSGIHVYMQDPVSAHISGKLEAYRICENFDTVSKLPSISREWYQEMPDADKKCYEEYADGEPEHAVGAMKLKSGLEEPEGVDHFSSSFILLSHTIDIDAKDSKGEKTVVSVPFFTLYSNLLPDLVNDTVAKYNEDFESISQGIKRIPFYRSWEFKINQDGYNYPAIRYYSGHSDVYELSVGVISDNRFLTQANNTNLNCKFLNNSKEIQNFPMRYAKIVESDVITVQALNANVNFYNKNATKLDAPRGTYKTNIERNASQDNFVVIDGKRCLKVSATANQLSLTSYTGSLYQSSLKHLSENKYYAIRDEDAEPISLLEASVCSEDAKDYFFLCTYKALITAINELEDMIPSNFLESFLEWLLPSWFNKVGEDIVRRTDLILDVAQSQKEPPSDESLVIICNDAKRWAKDEKWTDEQVYDVAVTAQESTLSFSCYIHEETFMVLKEQVETGNIQKMQCALYTIKKTRGTIQFPERFLKEDGGNINLLSGSLLKGKTYLSENANFEWLLPADGLQLKKGPKIQITKASEENRDFSQANEKGLMLFDSPGWNARKIITEDDVIVFTCPDDFLYRFSGQGWYRVTVGDTQGFIQCASQNMLLAKTVINPDYKVDGSIQCPTSPTNTAIMESTILGYGSAINQGVIDREPYHDIAIFMKNTDFMEKDGVVEKHYILPNTSLKTITKQTEPIMQKFLGTTEFSIIEEKIIRSEKIFKVKISKVPLFFRQNEIVNFSTEKDINCTISNKIAKVILYNFRIEMEGNKLVPSNKFSIADTSIFSSMFKNESNEIDLSCFYNKSFASLNETTKDNYALLMAEVESLSPELWIIENDAVELADKKLVVCGSSNDIQSFTIYDEEPFKIETCNLAEKGMSDKYLASIDETKSISIDSADYVPFMFGTDLLYIKKSDIQKENILDWKKTFQVLEGPGNEDVYCNVKEEVIDKLDGIPDGEKTALEECLFDAQKLKAILNDPEESAIKSTLRKIMVSHPLEWNKELYKDLKPLLASTTQIDIDYMAELMEKADIWSGIKGIKGIDNTLNLTYTHPLYFLSIMELVGAIFSYIRYPDLGSNLDKAVQAALDEKNGWNGGYMQVADGTTFCNYFLFDIIKDVFGDDVHGMVFMDKKARWFGHANDYYDLFERNPALEPLTPDNWPREAIQEEVDTHGTLIIAAAHQCYADGRGWKNTGRNRLPGHVGIVAPSTMTIQAKSVLTNIKVAFEGEKVDTKEATRNKDVMQALPLIVQAGWWNGIMGFGNAFGNRKNGNAFIKDNYDGGYISNPKDVLEKQIRHKMRFYRIRRN